MWVFRRPMLGTRDCQYYALGLLPNFKTQLKIISSNRNFVCILRPVVHFQPDGIYPWIVNACGKIKSDQIVFNNTDNAYTRTQSVSVNGFQPDAPHCT